MTKLLHCKNLLDNGQTCGARMEEKSVFYSCPICGSIVEMTPDEIVLKIKREKQITTELAHRVFSQAPLSQDGSPIFARPSRQRSEF